MVGEALLAPLKLIYPPLQTSVGILHVAFRLDDDGRLGNCQVLEFRSAEKI